jgi:protein tyrosine/serine phosphatase
MISTAVMSSNFLLGNLLGCVLVALLVSVPPAQAQSGLEQVPSGVSIAFFEHIDQNIYAGSKPHTEKDFEFLRSKHIKYILNVRFLPFFSGSEKSMAKRYGMTFISVPMNASPVAPQEKHVNRILLTIRDKEYQPIYVHCVLGRDRTSLIAGLYKIYFLGVPKNQAWEEMKESGFRTPWYLHGLKSYFDKHADSQPPLAASN